MLSNDAYDAWEARKTTWINTKGGLLEGIPPLFHYCSEASMLGILRTGSLWMSSSNSLNDTTEGSFLRSRIEAFIDDGSYGGHYPETLALAHTLLDEIFDDDVVTYMACFSEAEDRLSQWRAYADGGAGYALGFGGNAFRALNRPPSAFSKLPDELACSLVHVRYADDRVLSSVYDTFSELIVNGEAIMNANTLAGLSHSRWVYKNPAFGEEREMRLLFVPGADAIGPHAAKREYRSSARGVASFYPFEFHPAALQTLWCGPLCPTADSELELLLRDQGLGHVELRRAAATLR